MAHKDLNFLTDWDKASIVYVSTSFDINLQIFWMSYAHVLLRLKAQIIFFSAAKIMYHFTQPL